MFSFEMYDKCTGEVYYTILCDQIETYNNLIVFRENGHKIGECYLFPERFGYTINVKEA